MSGLAVVNNKGTLVGSISVSDLKVIYLELLALLTQTKLAGFKEQYWSLLSKPISEYLKEVRYHPEAKVRPSVFALLHDELRGIVVKCKPNHSFGYVIRLLAYYRIHRLFIVDDSTIPIGVISLTDILSTILTLIM